MLINSQMRILHQSGIVLCRLKQMISLHLSLFPIWQIKPRGIEENSHVRTYPCFIYCYFLAWCLAKYLSKVMTNQPMVGDGLFRWIENPVYRLLGISPQQQMNWKQYSLAFVVSCVF